MMTRLEERSRVKCDRYWPVRGSEIYGHMTISLVDFQDLATYCIRTFKMQKVSFFILKEHLYITLYL